jgi:hypothetical protein
VQHALEDEDRRLAAARGGKRGGSGPALDDVGIAAPQRPPRRQSMARTRRQSERIERALGRSPLANDLEPVLVDAAWPTAVARDKPRLVAAGDQRIR